MISVDPADLALLSNEFNTASDNVASVLNSFATVGGDGSKTVFGSGTAADNFNSLHDTCKNVINQVSSSLAAISQKLQVAANSYDQYQASITPSQP